MIHTIDIGKMGAILGPQEKEGSFVQYSLSVWGTHETSQVH
jgi:hypothetical protein